MKDDLAALVDYDFFDAERDADSLALAAERQGLFCNKE